MNIAVSDIFYHANTSQLSSRKISILGTRGIPASHGGFETFAERLALWLHRKGWQVTVYCQGSEALSKVEDYWQDIRRVHIPVRSSGVLATIEFDILATVDASRQKGIILTLGYNTGFLSILLRVLNRPNLINMDGLEWKRQKYSPFAKAYLWLNERLAARAGNLLIADHPAIAKHLATRVSSTKIVTIPYGSESVSDADPSLLLPLEIQPNRFFTIIARPEPENSILELVRAYSSKSRDAKLVVLGSYRSENSYEAAVRSSGSREVIFPGAIYDRETLNALRRFSLAYIHGHQVGGTNPSLVEALGAGSPVLAHDNRFNRWVAGEAAIYFTNEVEVSDGIDRLINDPVLRLALSSAARRRWATDFQWDDILQRYEDTLFQLNVSNGRR